MEASVTEVSVDLSAAKDSEQWPQNPKPSPGHHAK